MSDLYSLVFGRGRQPARRGPDRNVDLSRPAPSTTRRAPLVAPAISVEDSRQARRLTPGGPLGHAQRNAYLAQGVVEAERQRPDAMLRPSTRTVQGTEASGQVRYGERPRDLGEIIDDASARTGAPREYLGELIAHESSGNARAQAGSSTATGAAQFTDGTWFSMVQRYGARYGEEGARVAGAIRGDARRGFKFEGMSRAEVLNLRNNPAWSALMAGHFADENAAALRVSIGRAPREGEVYLAHFLGSRDAGRLINAASQGTMTRGHNTEPAKSFVDQDSVDANPQIFYEGGNYEWRVHPRTGRRYQHYLGGGRARSAREVIELQSRRFRNVEYQSTASEGGAE